jgi:hypothetical protein
MSRHRHSDNDLADGMAGGMAVIAIAVIILAIYLTVKAINLVVRVLSKYPVSRCPGCKIVWICLGCVFVCGFLAAVTDGESVAVVLCGFSVAILLITSRLVELYYDGNFQQDRGPLLTQVLRGSSWWEGTEVKAA